MQTLNLKLDNPQAFEGRLLSLKGSDYQVGPLLRYSDQGWMHQLMNTKSGLSIHMIQIRPEYKTNPVVALESARANQKAAAKLRTLKRVQQSPPNTHSYRDRVLRWKF